MGNNRRIRGTGDGPHGTPGNEAGRRGRVSVMLTWVDVRDELPDADITVLIFSTLGEVMMGFLDGETWRDSNAEAVLVSHWAEMPAPPVEDGGAGGDGPESALLASLPARFRGREF